MSELYIYIEARLPLNKRGNLYKRTKDERPFREVKHGWVL